MFPGLRNEGVSASHSSCGADIAYYSSPDLNYKCFFDVYKRQPDDSFFVFFDEAWIDSRVVQ